MRTRHRISYVFFLLCALFLVLAGCDDNERTTSRSQRVDNRLIDGVPKEEPPQVKTKSSVKQTNDYQPATKPSLTPEEPLSNPQTEETEQRENSTEEERELEAELRSLIGDPMSCLSPEPGTEMPDTIEIDLEAYVTTNGVVSRSGVRSSYLSNTALTCVKARIDNARFRAPVADAPRAIRTTVTLRQVKPTRPKPR